MKELSTRYMTKKQAMKEFMARLLEIQQRVNGTILKMRSTFLKKSKCYGTRGFQYLGTRGIFADVNRKYRRLKNLVWDSNKNTSNETTKDTWLDLAVYSVFGMILDGIECSRKSRKQHSLVSRKTTKR